jgi:hypothetical protein
MGKRIAGGAGCYMGIAGPGADEPDWGVAVGASGHWAASRRGSGQRERVPVTPSIPGPTAGLHSSSAMV